MRLSFVSIIIWLSLGALRGVCGCLCCAAILSDVLRLKHPANQQFRLRKVLLWLHLMDLQLVCRTVQMVTLHAWSLINGTLSGGEVLPSLSAGLRTHAVDVTRARTTMGSLVRYVANATAIDCEAVLADPDISPDAPLLACNPFAAINHTLLLELLTVPLLGPLWGGKCMCVVVVVCCIDEFESRFGAFLTLLVISGVETHLNATLSTCKLF